MLQYHPADGICEEKVCKHLAHVAKFVRVQSVNRIIRVAEYLLERRHVDFVDLTETLTRQ